ncbi:hypothetical protein FQN54_001752 [Arachnomyces sp. PD_36]|nr:hypothetical protein FQN54_001752 [Arachnomyces sp. PD_36]
MPRNHPPWSREAWENAWAAFDRGDYGPERSYPIAISDSGPFTSAEELQKVSGPPVEVKWVSKATLAEDEEDSAHAEKVMICELSEAQWNRIYRSSMEQMFVWIDGKKRLGWVVQELECSPDEGP